MSAVVTRLCIVRHGETPWNVERRLQGHLDVPLNDLGWAQAHAAGAWLKQQEGFTALYSSDLTRAWQTAQCIGEAVGLTPQAAPGFRERRYGVFEGLTYDQAEQQFPEEYARFQAREPLCDFGGQGETLQAFFERIAASLQEVAARHPGETVIVVAHGGVLDAINRFVRQRPLQAARDFHIPNAGLNWLAVENGNWRIDAWGFTEHLSEGALDELRFA